MLVRQCILLLGEPVSARHIWTFMECIGCITDAHGDPVCSPSRACCDGRNGGGCLSCPEVVACNGGASCLAQNWWYQLRGRFLSCPGDCVNRGRICLAQKCQPATHATQVMPGKYKPSSLSQGCTAAWRDLVPTVRLSYLLLTAP
jgi:hypothetical protein